MDKLRFYKDCDEALHLLMTNDYTIFWDDLCKISPDYATAIIQEFTSKDIAKHDQNIHALTIDRVKARPLYWSRYYERLADEAEANLKRDQLSERSTVSAEESARWARKSSDSATRANWISIASIIISITVAIVQIVIGCSHN